MVVSHKNMGRPANCCVHNYHFCDFLNNHYVMFRHACRNNRVKLVSVRVTPIKIHSEILQQSQTDHASAFKVDHVKSSSHLVWSPCKIWLLFLIMCAHM